MTDEAPGEPRAPAPASNRNTLKTIGVVAALLGAHGLLSTVGVVLDLAMADAGQQMWTYLPGLYSELFEAQAKMMRELRALQQPFQPVQVLLSIANLALSSMLLFGAVKLLKDDLTGSRIVALGCAFGALFEIARFPLHLYLQVQSLPILEAYMAQTTADLGHGLSATALARNSFVGGMATSVVFMSIKLAFYAYAAVTLRGLQEPGGAGAPTA